MPVARAAVPGAAVAGVILVAVLAPDAAVVARKAQPPRGQCLDDVVGRLGPRGRRGRGGEVGVGGGEHTGLPVVVVVLPLLILAPAGGDRKLGGHAGAAGGRAVVAAAATAATAAAAIVGVFRVLVELLVVLVHALEARAHVVRVEIEVNRWRRGRKAAAPAVHLGGWSPAYQGGGVLGLGVRSIGKRQAKVLGLGWVGWCAGCLLLQSSIINHHHRCQISGQAATTPAPPESDRQP